ncbi:hypothetical protein Nepgr_017602 [Nepenthes gracilis]|uniref:Uncharacterized protein n=1 Tax=Nepenthes gracilis TaxID=150966 RepID=A0AAD3SSC0_NEPGR|nr:hypothetical protein Nepgr_017602 [Nepenthes gracilis]
MSFVSVLLPAVSKCRVSPNFHPFNNRTRNFYEGSDLRNSSALSSPFSSNSWSRSVLSRKRGRETLIPFCDKNPQSANEDRRALETVLRLYSAIKSRDLEELSDIIGEECRCVSNFVLAFKPLHGKQVRHGVIGQSDLEMGA